MSYENPEEYITATFKELRRLYGEGHQKQIEDEIVFMTQQHLHHDSGQDCVRLVRDGDYTVFDGGADVVWEYLNEYGGEITDLAAEAIVRRLESQKSFTEIANFNNWLEILGFEPLKKMR